MKGDENRGEKLFQKIILGDKFREGIFRIRTKSKIPESGFDNEKELNRWYSKHKSSVETMDRLTPELLSELGLPNIFWWWHKIIEHILSNGKIKIYPDKLQGKDPFIEIGYEYRSKTGRTDLQLYPGVTKQEIDKFYRANKIFIEPILKQDFTKKIRGIEQPEVRKRIIELWTKTKKELGGKYDETKEILISRILKKEERGHYEPENIKQIYYRTKNSKR